MSEDGVGRDHSSENGGSGEIEEWPGRGPLAAEDTPCPSPSKFGSFGDRPGSIRPGGLTEPLLAGEGDSPALGGWARLGTDAWKRRASMVFICYLVLVGDGNRGLVLPTLQGYLGKFGGTSKAVGIANAGFSAGRLLAAPIYGYWMDKRNTGEVVLFSMVVCAACNLLYTYASYAGSIDKVRARDLRTIPHHHHTRARRRASDPPPSLSLCSPHDAEKSTSTRRW